MVVSAQQIRDTGLERKPRCSNGLSQAPKSPAPDPTPMKRLVPFLLACLLWPTAAAAHGDTPLAEEITAMSGDSGEPAWVLRTNFGILTSQAPKRYVCEEAFSGGDDFQLAVFGMREWLIFTDEAIVYTADGCNFERRQQLSKKVAAVAVGPDRTRAAYLMNGEDSTERGIWWTDDNGQSFVRVGVDTSRLNLTGAGFLDQNRLFVTAYSTEDATQGGARVLTVDLGNDTSQTIGTPAGATFPYLFDTAGDWIAWMATKDGEATLFWGPTDEPARYALAVDSWPSGAVLADDGQSVWFSGVHAPSRGLTVGHTSADPVWSDILVDHSGLCIGGVGERRYLCARRDREGHDLSRIDGDTVEPVLRFADLEGPLECPDDSELASSCGAVWPDLAGALDIEVDSSAGDHDHGDHDHGGCAAAGARWPSPSSLAGILVLVTGLFSCRRRK